MTLPTSLSAGDCSNLTSSAGTPIPLNSNNIVYSGPLTAYQVMSQDGTTFRGTFYGISQAGALEVIRVKAALLAQPPPAYYSAFLTAFSVSGSYR